MSALFGGSAWWAILDARWPALVYSALIRHWELSSELDAHALVRKEEKTLNGKLWEFNWSDPEDSDPNAYNETFAYELLDEPEFGANGESYYGLVEIVRGTDVRWRVKQKKPAFDAYM